MRWTVWPARSACPWQISSDPFISRSVGNRTPGRPPFGDQVPGLDRLVSMFRTRIRTPPVVPAWTPRMIGRVFHTHQPGRLVVATRCPLSLTRHLPGNALRGFPPRTTAVPRLRHTATVGQTRRTTPYFRARAGDVGPATPSRIWFGTQGR